MATNAQIYNFIKLIAPDVQKAYKTLGKVKPSVCIGMACVESGAGTSATMSKHNALWGQKVGSGKTATKYWTGTFYTSKTKEEYQVGKHTIITDAFRSYPSILMGALNYYELLNTKLYARVKSDASPEEQMRQIKACGYMTSSTEVNSVISYINRFDLKNYDDVAQGLAPEHKNPYKVPTKTLRIGDHNEMVKWLQYELNEHYSSNLAVDGWYGSKTKSAIIKVQNHFGLIPDGICGRKTFAKLGVTI